MESIRQLFISLGLEWDAAGFLQAELAMKGLELAAQALVRGLQAVVSTTVEAVVQTAEYGSALDDAFHDLLATIACHAAVRANQEVSPEEARALLDGLDAVDFKARCPHGRPVVFELQPSELERRVGRR